MAALTNKIGASVAIFTFFVFLWDFAKATPVRGLSTCLNHEDCIGANRHCLRNLTMTVGVCVCDEGFKPSKTDQIKCIFLKDECDTDSDCPIGLTCHQPPGYYVLRVNNVVSDVIPPVDAQLARKCVIRYGSPGVEPQTGGGLRAEFIDHYYTFGRRNRVYSGFHPQYIKFVEDAMLVLFLLCVLVTLLVVHRATCYRQFRNSRRNGRLRHIIPHRDDQPPPYGNCGPRPHTNGAEGVTDELDVAQVEGIRVTSESDKGETNDSCGRGETPPPTYDEALVISQTSNTPVPLYIALPPPDRTTSDNNPVQESERASSSSSADVGNPEFNLKLEDPQINEILSNHRIPESSIVTAVSGSHQDNEDGCSESENSHYNEYSQEVVDLVLAAEQDKPKQINDNSLKCYLNMKSNNNLDHHNNFENTFHLPEIFSFIKTP